MITVKSEWNRYYDQVLKVTNMTEHQKKLAEIYFFSGSYSMLNILRTLGTSGIPPEEGAKIIHKLVDECMEFLLTDFYKELAAQDDASVH